MVLKMQQQQQEHQQQLSQLPGGRGGVATGKIEGKEGRKTTPGSPVIGPSPLGSSMEILEKAAQMAQLRVS